LQLYGTIAEKILPTIQWTTHCATVQDNTKFPEHSNRGVNAQCKGQVAFAAFQGAEAKCFTYFAGGFFATLPLTGVPGFLGVLSSSDSVTDNLVLA
jgi:hypothetical protein